MAQTKEKIQFEEITIPGYERIVKATDSQSGLKALFAVHNTTLGPALGGTRMYPYLTFEAALNDVLRLSRGMTYKSAVAGIGLGGGKSVIIGDPRKDKTEALFLSFGEALNTLKGQYICAEDYGTTPDDMEIIARQTPYIVGLHHEKSSGNPAIFTAWGIVRGMQAAMQELDGSPSLAGKTIAIQGIGSVGTFLLDFLFWQGAKLIISDIYPDRVTEAAVKYGAKICSPQEILSVSCDILSPCALGAIFTTQTIPTLRCRAIVGAANNQLLKEEHGDQLVFRHVLYAPDFLVNAGGVINVSEEIYEGGYSPINAHQRVHGIYDQLLTVFDIAKKNRISTHAAAISLGDYRIKYGIGKRMDRPYFHHSNLIKK